MNMHSNNDRIIIYAKDIATIAGVCERTGFRILSRIRKQLGKPGRSFVSIKEFCEYMKLKEDLVRESLK